MRILPISSVVLVLALLAAPANARRTAIDQDGDTPIYFELGGYCDINGDDCEGQSLGYSVRFGGGEATDRVVVHGNGILSFGNPIDFSASPPEGGDSFGNRIDRGETPLLESYGLDLVSAGQNNSLDGYAFFQTGKLGVDSSGTIRAEWYTCYFPLSSSICPASSQQFLTLSPRKNGFSALLRGEAQGNDIGFVRNGVFTPTAYGTRFFIPAEITGIDFGPGVPEPSSWALLIAGFGLTGASLRRRRAALAG